MESRYSKKKKIWLIASFLISCVILAIGLLGANVFYGLDFPMVFWSIIILVVSPFSGIIMISLLAHVLLRIRKNKSIVVVLSLLFIIVFWCILPDDGGSKLAVILIGCGIGWGHYAITFFIA